MAHALVTGVLRDGRSLGASRRATLDSRLDPRDRALAQELAFGTLRHLQRLDAWLEHVAARPPRDAEVRVLVLIGLYQLGLTRIPPHAAVSTTVDLARSLGKPWAAGFVNAALRRFAAERDAILDIDLAATARLAHPAWLLAALERSWPAQWESIARANLGRPPMTLRVNTHRISRRRYLDSLSNSGIAARPTRHSVEGVALESPRDVESVPGFGDGLVSVQDEAAQLAAPLLDAPRGSRVLDACAAPGGKTAHIVERGAGTVDVVALDDDPRRIADLERTLARLGLSAHARIGDAGGESRIAHLVGRTTVRAHPARCPVLGNRSHSASSRHQGPAPTGRHRDHGAAPERHAACAVASSGSGRTPAVRYLLRAVP